MNHPLIIGHRGAKGHITENSLPSVEKAIELGADGIEIDVHKLKSGEIVVFHDHDSERMTGVPGAIVDYTLDELRKLKLTGGYKIPLLTEVLDLAGSQKFINIELKGRYTAEKVTEIIEHYVTQKGWNYKNIIVSSFRWEELKRLREFSQKIQIGVLSMIDLGRAVRKGKELNAQAIHPDFRMLTQETVSLIKKEGFLIYTWTVNEREDINNMASLGVDGIITDYPDRAK